MILPHIIPNLFDKDSSPRNKILPGLSFVFPITVSLVVALVNPNGVNGILYLVKSYGNARMFSQINELQAPRTASFAGFFVIAASVILSLYVYKNFHSIFTKQLDISKIYMFVGVLLLAMLHLRNLWTLLFGIVPVLSELLSKKTILNDETYMALSTKPRLISGNLKNCIGYCFLCMFLITGSVYIFYGSIPNKAASLPIDAVSYLNSLYNDKEDIVLFNEFNTGGYLEWCGYNVYIDARPELFQKKVNGVADVADEYYAVKSGECDYDAFTNKYNFTHVLVDNNSYFSMYLSFSDEYISVSKDDNYTLFERINFK